MHRVLLIAPLLTACGSFGTAYSARTALAEAECERAFACQTTYDEASDVAFDVLYGESVGDCEERLAPDPSRRDAWKEAERDSALEYDAAAAKACRTALRGATCEAFWSTEGLDACASVVAGTVAADGSCAFDEVCASGLCRDGVCD